MVIALEKSFQVIRTDCFIIFTFICFYNVWKWGQIYAVKVRRHTPWSRVRCHGSHECWFTQSQFHSQFHSRRHSLPITLKYTTLVHMRSGYAWTMKSWQRSEWRLGFNSVLHGMVLQIMPGASFMDTEGSEIMTRNYQSYIVYENWYECHIYPVTSFPSVTLAISPRLVLGSMYCPRHNTFQA